MPYNYNFPHPRTHTIYLRSKVLRAKFASYISGLYLIVFKQKGQLQIFWIAGFFETNDLVSYVRFFFNRSAIYKREIMDFLSVLSGNIYFIPSMIPIELPYRNKWKLFPLSLRISVFKNYRLRLLVVIIRESKICSNTIATENYSKTYDV